MPNGVNIPLMFEIYRVGPQGDQYVRTETLNQDIIKVGKLSSSHLRIEDEAVSRMHAVIEISSQDEIYIIDLGSTKGTLVNGQRINKVKLQSGDQILIGNTKLVVTVGEAQSAQEDGPTTIQRMPQTGVPQAGLPQAPAPQAPRQTQPPPARATVMGIGAQPSGFPPPGAPAPTGHPAPGGFPPAAAPPQQSNPFAPTMSAPAGNPPPPQFGK